MSTISSTVTTLLNLYTSSNRLFKSLMAILLAVSLFGWPDALHAQFNHQVPVADVEVSPDGNKIYTAAHGNVYVWDGSTHFELRNIEEQLISTIFDLAVSPDNSFFVIANERIVFQYDAETAVLDKTYRGHSAFVTALEVTPDASQIVTGSLDKTVKVWNVSNEQVFHDLKGHSSAVTGVSVSPDGRYIASGSADGTVKLWSLASGDLVHSYEIGEKVNAVDFAPDSKQIAAGTEQSRVHILNVGTKRLEQVIEDPLDAVSAITIMEGSDKMGIGLKDGSVMLYELGSNAILFNSKRHSKRISGVAFSADGTRMYTSSIDRYVHTWKTESGEESIALQPKTNDINWAVPHPTDPNQIVTAYRDGSVRFYDLSTLEVTASYDNIHDNPISSISLNSDGSLMTTAGEDNTAYLWNTRSQQKTGTINAHTDPVKAAVFHPNKPIIASAAMDGKIYLWDQNSMRQVKEFRGHPNGINDLTYSPDGSVLASVGAVKHTIFWEAESGRILHDTPHDNYLNRGVFINGGDDYAVASFKKINVVNVASGQITTTFEGHGDWVNDIAASPDGNLLASGSANKELILWKVSDRSIIAKEIAHSSYVNCVTFTTDGKYVVSGSYDGTIKIWSAKDLSLVNTIKYQDR